MNSSKFTEDVQAYFYQLAYFSQHTCTRGGSKISGKGIHLYKGVRFAWLILSYFLLNIR